MPGTRRPPVHQCLEAHMAASRSSALIIAASGPAAAAAAVWGEIQRAGNIPPPSQPLPPSLCFSFIWCSLIVSVTVQLHLYRWKHRLLPLAGSSKILQRDLDFKSPPSTLASLPPSCCNSCCTCCSTGTREEKSDYYWFICLCLFDFFRVRTCIMFIKWRAPFRVN